MRRDREDELNLADIGGEADAATHAEKIASPRHKPKRGVEVKPVGVTVVTQF